MALKGNLVDFGLEAIFQLINSDKKTGTLHISRKLGDAEGFIYFRFGRIFGAVSNFNRKPLGERLVNAGHITKEQLHSALEAQRQAKRRRKLGQILISEGLITQDILRAFVKEQIQNTVFDLLPWKEGEFSFLEDQLPASEDMGLMLSARKILSKGGARLDEWERIHEKVPSVKSIFEHAELVDDQVQSAGLTELHKKILALIDGHRRVTDIAKTLESSEFEISSHIYDLVDISLIRLKSEVDDSEADEDVQSEAIELIPDDSLDELELSTEDLISDRAQYISELVAMTDNIRHGHKIRVLLPSISTTVLAEKVHMDHRLERPVLEKLIKFVEGL